MNRAAAALEEPEDYLRVPESDSQQATDVEEILQGLSSDDLDQLKKYVADNLGDDDLAEQTDSDETAVVRRVAQDDESLNDNIGELIGALYRGEGGGGGCRRPGP